MCRARLPPLQGLLGISHGGPEARAQPRHQPGQGRALPALPTLPLPRWWPGLGSCAGDGGGRQAPSMRKPPGSLGTLQARCRPCSVFAWFPPREWELACSQTPNQRAARALPTPSFTLTIIDRGPSVTIGGTEAGREPVVVMVGGGAQEHGLSSRGKVLAMPGFSTAAAACGIPQPRPPPVQRPPTQQWQPGPLSVPRPAARRGQQSALTRSSLGTRPGRAACSSNAALSLLPWCTGPRTASLALPWGGSTFSSRERWRACVAPRRWEPHR